MSVSLRVRGDLRTEVIQFAEQEGRSQPCGAAEKEFNIVQDLIDKARSSPGAANDVLRNCRGILSQAIS